MSDFSSQKIIAKDIYSIGKALGISEDVIMTFDECCAEEEHWGMEPELLIVLAAWIHTIRPHTIVEIGTYEASTSIFLAKILNRNHFGHIYTIDDGSAGKQEVAKDRIKESKLQDRIIAIESTSMKAFSNWGRATIDLLIIDGAHDFVSMCTDFCTWARYLGRNGLIVVHDTVTRLDRRFPEDYIFPLDAFEIIDVVELEDRPSGHEWEGAAFIRPRQPGITSWNSWNVIAKNMI